MNIIQANNLTRAQLIYNEKVRSIRQIIERTIGVLKVRFRCILGERQLRYDPTKVSKIIYTCATLHNFLILNGYDIMHEIDDNYLQIVINNNQGLNNANVAIVADRNAGLVRQDILANWLLQQN